MFRRQYPASLSRSATCRELPLERKISSDEEEEREIKQNKKCLQRITEEGLKEVTEKKETKNEISGGLEIAGGGLEAISTPEESGRIDERSEHRASDAKSLPLNFWGIGWKSEDDLPRSVTECFEDPSLLARLQARLFTLLGRANRYRLQKGFGAPVMSLDTLRRKVKEARRRLLHYSASTNSPPPSPSSTTSSSHPLTRQGTCESIVSPDSPTSRLSSSNEILSDTLSKSPNSSSQGDNLYESLTKSSRLSSPGASLYDTITKKQNNSNVIIPSDYDTMQHYWGGELGGGEEELELLQQYLNLQQLAVSRKHSTQLRRIRDSLLARVRSRPTSMIKMYQQPSSTVPSPKHINPKAPVPDKERQALRNFLLDIGFVQYYSLLNRHGYDLATAAHMDALDLASVGITEPLHRMAIKFELDLIKRPPPVPAEIAETCEEWLSSMGLEDYVANFHQNGIYCPLAALALTKRDLQVMGIYMLGHRKKILLSILGMKEALLRRE